MMNATTLGNELAHQDYNRAGANPRFIWHAEALLVRLPSGFYAPMGKCSESTSELARSYANTALELDWIPE